METKQVKGIEKKVALPEGVHARMEGTKLILKGHKGEVSRDFESAQVALSLENNAVVLRAPRDARRFRAILNTFVAHIKNMHKGAAQGHVYLLRICSGHFPMNVAVVKDELVIKNFLGERVPRTMPVPKGVKITINGRDILVESSDKEQAGMVAAHIEQVTRRSNFDRRRFQDGIYIVTKDGKDIK